jgi:hypothetical protein
MATRHGEVVARELGAESEDVETGGFGASSIRTSFWNKP